MGTEGFEQYLKMGKLVSTPWNDIGKAFLEVCRRGTQEVMDITSDNLIRTADQIKRFGTATKRPEELFNFQKECLNENTTAFVGTLQRVGNICLSSVEELNKVFTSNFKDQQSGTYNSNDTFGGKKQTEKQRG